MSGPGDPPEGTPEGAPGGGDDDYRSVVFDESFVRAARIQEYSAQERLDGGGAARAVRVRHAMPHVLARQAMALVLLLVLAFGFAVYMGVRHPYRSDPVVPAARLRTTVIPLVPTGPVAAVSAASPFAGSSAAHYPIGVAGIDPDGPRRIGDFSEQEVDEAYATAKEYLTDSSLDPSTVLAGDVGAVRNLLSPGQLDQFDASLTRPADDGMHEATGWLVRFDPAARVRLVTDEIRVQGTLQAAETTDNQLEVAADHTFVYALRGPAPAGAASLFTVRRQLTFRFDHEDLREHHIQVARADIAAGPLACVAPLEGFRPIFAGHTASGPAPSGDPYDHDHPVGAVCTPMGGANSAKSGAAGPGDLTGTGGTAGPTASSRPLAPRAPATPAVPATRGPLTPAGARPSWSSPTL